MSDQARTSARLEHTQPTVPPPEPQGLSPVLERNIRALSERRIQEEKAASLQSRVAEAITHFTGSMAFVYVHLAILALWVLVNIGVLPIMPKWDESFVVLGTAASVEAIFLSTFVLISQNRMAAAADQRADLDLQVSLLAEHEITRVVTIVAEIARKLDVRTDADQEVHEIAKDIAPEAVLDEIEAAKR